MNFEISTYGDSGSDTLLIQMVDDHDLEVIEKEAALIRELSGGQNFCLKAVKVKSWSHDLSPWPAPAVFGNEEFGDGAAQTLLFLQDEVLSNLPKNSASAISRVYIGGYSLAGLFALWAGYQTDCFDGIAAASPSIWFPGFLEYMRNNRIRTEAVYLSLGDREEKTKNPLMSQVGNAIRDAETILKKEGKECILEWNKGNHFKQPDLRTAKAFAWLMNR
jgi:predicted alpha/beta superfamily hydrolase